MHEKIVDFERYCATCKYSAVTEDENGLMDLPCDECLAHPVNEDSQKPIYYKEDK